MVWRVIEFRPDQPRWVQVAAVLRGRIEAGVYKVGMPVPSEPQICQEFGIARNTARKVLVRLREEGLVYSVPGLGTFVAAAEDSAKPTEGA
jgi:DNA-binding GntR family transcriptional regulator